MHLEGGGKFFCQHKYNSNTYGKTHTKKVFFSGGTTKVSPPASHLKLSGSKGFGNFLLTDRKKYVFSPWIDH